MAKQLRCGNQHQWTTPESAAATATLATCPFCGQSALPTDGGKAVATQTPSPPAPSMDDTLTGLPASGVSTQPQTIAPPVITTPPAIAASAPFDQTYQQSYVAPPPSVVVAPSTSDLTLAPEPASLGSVQTDNTARIEGPARIEGLAPPDASVLLDQTLQAPPSSLPAPPVSSSFTAAQKHSDPGSETLITEQVAPAGIPTGRIQSEAGQPTNIRPPNPRAQEGAPTEHFGSNAAQQVPALPQTRPAAGPISPVEGYEILGVLGKGGMGIVYKARQIDLDRIVALKMVLTRGRLSKGERERFQAEARAVAQMKHANILQVHAYGDSAGQPYFALEFVEGGTLQEKLENYSMPPREAALLVETLARALHYAHLQGILHRDIKPANVLLTTDGVPKISDFGLAVRLGRAESPNANEQVVGTPMYMPPEQAQGRADIGPAADVYSLGATLYEMIVGKPPFRGATVLDTLKMVQNSEPVAPRALQPAVPADLQTICLKCLHKDPKQRYESAAAFANDLRNFLDGRPIAARPVPAWEKAWKWSRRNPAAATLIAVSLASLLGLAVGGVGFAMVESDRADQERKGRKLADDFAMVESERADQERKGRQLADELADQERKGRKLADDFAIAEKKRADEEVKLRKLADDRGKEALDNFRSAQDAVEVLVNLAKSRMANERHLETVGKELLEKALVFYDGFLAKEPNDPLMRLTVARAQFLAGDLREKLGRYEKAEAGYVRAEKLYRDLIHDHPDMAADLRRDLAAVYINQSTVLQVLKNDPAAEKAFASAQDLLEKSAAKQSRDPVTDWLLAAGFNNRGTFLHQRGQLTEAAQAYQQGIALFGGLASRFPNEHNYHLELAKTKTNLAYRWTIPSPGDSDKAAPLYREAIDELAPLVKAHRDVPAYRKELGRAYLNRGILNTNQERYDDAGADLRNAGDTYDELAAEYPGVSDYRYLAATAHLNLGTLRRRQEQLPSSADAYRQAEKLLEKLVIGEPKIAAYRHDWALCTGELARVLETQIRASAKTLKANPDDPNLVLPTHEAEKTWYQALERWTKLNAEFPGELRYAAQMIRTHEKVCSFHKYMASVFRKVKPAEAETHLQQRVTLRKDMLAELPGDDLLKEQTAESLLALALMRVEMKNHTASAATIEEMTRVLPADLNYYPLGAGCLAQCLALAGKGLDVAQRDQTIKAYGDRALVMLDLAAAAGWVDLKYLQTHPILQPLRDRPEYRPRLDELRKRIELAKSTD